VNFSKLSHEAWKNLKNKMAALLRLVTMFSMTLYSGAALQASAGDITAVLAALKEEGTKVLQQLFPPRESLVSDITAGDGNVGKLFFSVYYNNLQMLPGMKDV
jgi:hypothetical protein